MSNNERAIQFMPFNSLAGYYDLIENVEKIKAIKKELTDDELDELNKMIHLIEIGMMVKITYYEKDSYFIKEGILSAKNLLSKTLKIVKDKISINNICKIEII